MDGQPSRRRGVIRRLLAAGLLLLGVLTATIVLPASDPRCGRASYQTPYGAERCPTGPFPLALMGGNVLGVERRWECTVGWRWGEPHCVVVIGDQHIGVDGG